LTSQTGPERAGCKLASHTLFYSLQLEAIAQSGMAVAFSPVQKSRSQRNGSYTMAFNSSLLPLMTFVIALFSANRPGFPHWPHATIESSS
jgi:hypothetical protein